MATVQELLKSKIIATSSEELHKAEAKEEKPKLPVGGYKALELQRFANSTGVLVYPKDGYFVPADQDEYDILEYFVTVGNKVEAAVSAKGK